MNQFTSITAHKMNFNDPLDENRVNQEAYTIETECDVCGEMGENSSCTISIPYFRDLLIMAFKCSHCGAKNNEVKSNSSITEKGKLIVLKANCPLDLKRDLFKSETAGIEIPELELELSYGTLGGVYTTVEGILEKVLEHLEKHNPWAGDQESDFKQRMQKLFGEIRKLMEGESEFTLIIKDPVDNSFLQNPYFPQDDQRVKVVLFERSEDDDDFLGIVEMNTENY